MTNKNVAFITGANRGIRLVTARELYFWTRSARLLALWLRD